MDWESYEDMVRYIYEQLGRLDSVKILCSGSDCKVMGKSGVNHQIDVLTSHRAGPHSYKTAIECKYWKDKVQKDTITKLSEILEDAKIEKGILVSKSGFTQDAVKFAEYKNISLVELREPTDADWKGRVRDIVININVLIPNVYEYEFIPEVSAGSENRKSQQIDALSSDIFIHSPSGKYESIHEITNREISYKQISKEEEKKEESHYVEFPEGSMLSVPHNPDRIPIKAIRFKSTTTIVEEKKEESHYVEFPEGSMLSVPHNPDRIPIKAIRFKSTTTIVTEKIEIFGENYVAMIMSCIFENKRFVISPDGEIRESDFSTDR